jgi:acyl-CoA synthetase (AMP-forming)/AMP-acid ligase II
MPGSEARIVDPETRRELAHGEVGEVWLRGSHIAVGYWNEPEKSEETFEAHLACGEGPFLRTGDLAFSSPDGFYIVGRMKDLIILRGRNYAPSDVEQIWAELTGTVGQASAAAVQIELADDHVVLIAEARRSEARSMTENVIEALAAELRSAAMEKLEHGVTDLVVVQEGSIPRTTSGKVQRKKAGQLLEEGELPLVGIAGPIGRVLEQRQKRPLKVTP